VYVFIVQGWEFKSGLVRVWLTESTAAELERFLGTLDCETLSKTILAAEPLNQSDERALHDEEVRCIEVTRRAYGYLRECFDGVSDEHRMQLLLKQLREKRRATGGK